MTYTIRALNPEDASRLQSLRMEALRLFPNHFTAVYAQECTYPLTHFTRILQERAIFGALHGEQSVSTACLTPDLRPRNTHKAMLHMVYVTPSHHGQGVGRQTLNAAMAYAALHYEQVLLSVEATNHPAIHLYESLGFTRYGYEPYATLLEDGAYLDEVLMIRRFPASKDSQHPLV